MKAVSRIFVAILAVVTSGAVFADDRDESVLDVITVTAQKREQSLMEAPLSVWAFQERLFLRARDAALSRLLQGWSAVGGTL